MMNNIAAVVIGGVTVVTFLTGYVCYRAYMEIVSD